VSDSAEPRARREPDAEGEGHADTEAPPGGERPDASANATADATSDTPDAPAETRPGRAVEPEAETGSDAASSAREDDAERRSQLASGLFQRIRTARAALTVIRGYSFTGLLITVALGAMSFFYYQQELTQWICRVGAMGSLLGAVVGLNVMDRLVRGKSLPAGMVATALGFIAVALLGVGVGAVRYNLGAAWSPLLSATYVVVGVRILLRFRGQAPGRR